MRASGEDLVPVNFRVLRHFAAFSVLFAHSFVISGQLPMDLLAVLPFLAGAAPFGVTLFFIVSGYLVSQSWAVHPHVGAFLMRRGLRIFPALVVCVLFCVVMGAWCTDLSAQAYWEHPGVWQYVLRNLMLQNHLELPGVFASNPVAHAVNGSLWTIPLEVTCYLGVLVGGMLALRLRRIERLLALAAVVAFVVFFGEYLNLFGATVIADAMPGYYLAFCCGALCFLMRARVLMLSRWAAALIAFLLIMNGDLPWLGWVRVGLLSVLVVALAQWWGRAAPENRRGADFSYGVYLYAFPIQQAIAHFFPSLSGWGVLGGTLPLCVACATLSWYAIERPALGLKDITIARNR